MISEYLMKIESALKTNPTPYFPMGKEQRKRNNLQLGRDIGYGLGMYEDWETWADTTYGRFIVRNSQDSVGVVLDIKRWLAAIREGVERYRSYDVNPVQTARGLAG